MRLLVLLMLIFITLGWARLAICEEVTLVRPPAIPLVAHDPYFSVWSMTNALTDSWTRHWTGKIQALCGMARIDGKVFRFAGEQPGNVPAMTQHSVAVLPTRTIYQFEAGGVAIKVTFLTPALPDDLDVLSRPVTYVCFEAQGLDGAVHEIQLYLDLTAEWCVDKPEQKVVWDCHDLDGMSVMRMGTEEQAVLKKRGDDLRIDWGYMYLTVPKMPGVETAMGGSEASRSAFIASGRTLDNDDTRMPRSANDNWPVLATSLDLGKVAKKTVAIHLMIAYDDQYSIELHGIKLRPYWRRNGMEADSLLQAAENDYATLAEQCDKFDAALMKSLTKVGGRMYAQMCALGYRHSFAAQKICADTDGTPLMFSKENFSNGCISTVDVIYPAAPMFLFLNTVLMKAQLKPVLDYAASPRWPWPFAPHDLGQYPLANGQVYGGGEKTEKDQMPVEESANMLILLAATAHADGNADFAVKYWPTISKWAEYLRNKGLDPENQLCTDDFAGHLAHNANLSIKAIVALGSYAKLCETAGKKALAAQYRKLAEDMAQQWIKMAEDGDHYKLAFDKPGSWSQKYNLVWDKILKLKLFPAGVAQKEIAFYKKMQGPYGIALDNRKTYTKLDWLFWTATLADNRANFDTLLAPAVKFANETPNRVPLSDWYDTVTAKQEGFQARPVIGGLFIKMLTDDTAWKQWRK